MKKLLIMAVITAVIMPSASLAQSDSEMDEMYAAFAYMDSTLKAVQTAIQEIKNASNGDGAYTHQAFGEAAVEAARTRACSGGPGSLECIAFQESYKTPSVRRQIATEFVATLVNGDANNSDVAATYTRLSQDINRVDQQLRGEIKQVANNAATVSNKEASKEDRLRALEWLARY